MRFRVLKDGKAHCAGRYLCDECRAKVAAWEGKRTPPRGPVDEGAFARTLEDEMKVLAEKRQGSFVTQVLGPDPPPATPAAPPPKPEKKAASSAKVRAALVAAIGRKRITTPEDIAAAEKLIRERADGPYTTEEVRVLSRLSIMKARAR